MNQPAAPTATIVTTVSSFGLPPRERRMRPARFLGPARLCAKTGFHLFAGPRLSHPLGDLEDKPAEGCEADAPEKNDRDHGFDHAFPF
jgi:hypothetical protein